MLSGEDPPGFGRFYVLGFSQVNPSEFAILFFAVEMEGKMLAVDCGAAAGGAADDLKYISGLSTILVATIQEVKDQVSQMEFIFCSQLFPHIQAKAKLVQARLDDAMRAKEDEWRKREASLVNQLEELSSGKRQAEERLLRMGSSVEEMKGKLADSERMAARHEAEKKQLLGRLEDEMRKGEVIRRLQREIEEKAAEVTREREAHQRLLQQVDLKDKDLLLEQSKRRDLIEDYTQLKTNYKHLKSQYNFLLGKIDQNEGSKCHVDIPIDKRNSESPPSKRKLKGTAILILQSVNFFTFFNFTTLCSRFTLPGRILWGFVLFSHVNMNCWA